MFDFDYLEQLVKHKHLEQTVHHLFNHDANSLELSYKPLPFSVLFKYDGKGCTVLLVFRLNEICLIYSDVV